MFSTVVADKNTRNSRRLRKNERKLPRQKKTRKKTASNLVFTSMLIWRKYLPPFFKNLISNQRNLLHWSRELKMICKCFPNLKLHNRNEGRCLRKIKVCICIQQLHCGESFSPLTRWHDSNMQRFRERAAKFNNRKWIMIKKCQKTRNSPTFTDCWTRWTLTWALRHSLLIVLTRQELLFLLFILHHVTDIWVIDGRVRRWRLDGHQGFIFSGWKINFTSRTIKVKLQTAFSWNLLAMFKLFFAELL